MNHTASPSMSFPVTGQVTGRKNRDIKSLPRRILSRLAPNAGINKNEIRGYRGSGSFIEECLLDPRLGPEISRTLRR